ncbi:hypothetical protein BU16DRAFT_563881 [Lophium mytilinum]|uniref:Uncharacterized protein n=1 Tax=Lophium mytilinum TaxID=390894 RepID=A0A6A6QKD3_9PEZI|nr:hypothetical protein BU16DRAFT_563881 [Lophium mytilinum]
MVDPTPNDYANSAEFKRIAHWSEFGQRGEPPTERVTNSEWKQTHPFEKPVTSKWNQPIPRAMLPKLLNGFQPSAMEDKWFVYADGPDAEGNAVLHMHRSWTGFKIVEAKFVIQLDEDGGLKEEDACFTEIVWESDSERIRGHTDEKAKETVKGVCNWCMGVQLP